MATFNLGSAGNIQDLKQVKSYLYKLEEQLKYMFANLDPEENFDSRAKLIYAANAERQAALEVALEGITASYVTKETLSQLALTEDEAALRYVNKDGIISEINASSEQVTIRANKISLEGTVTANNYFKINRDGSMEAVSGKFAGELTIGGQNQGTLKIKNASGTDVGQWDATSLRIGPLSGGGYNYTVTSAGAVSIKNGSLTLGSGNTQINLDSSGLRLGGESASAAAFHVSNAGAVTIKNGSLSLGAITGTSPTKYAFTVSSSGARTTSQATDDLYGTTIYPYMELAGGVLRGGVDSTQYGLIQFNGSLTPKRGGPSTTALALRSQAVLLSGGVWTCNSDNPATATEFGKGKTVTYQKICANPEYIPDMDDYDFDLLQLEFLNGILVESRIIPIDDE